MSEITLYILNEWKNTIFGQFSEKEMWSCLILLACLCVGVEAAVPSTDRLALDNYSPFISKQDVNSSYLVPAKEVLATGILSAFTVTAVSEIGDRTFFIALVLALTHPSVKVLCGALSALALMTVLSACLGLVFSFLSALWVHYLSAFLFFAFGFKLLREGCLMSSNAGKEEFEEVQKTVEKKMVEKNKVSLNVEEGPPSSNVGIRVVLEAFTMTFISEWGDRSQIATVILAAKHNVFGVVLGSILGHAMCTLAAVVGGRLIADRISVRTVTLIGGVLFLAFGFSSLIGALEETFEDSISLA